MEYEMIREIFNRCSGNQMRDVFVSNVETDDPEAYVRSLLVGKEIKLEKSEAADGSVIIDVEINELRQRFSFSP
jgi:hypothetical protein